MKSRFIKTVVFLFMAFVVDVSYLAIAPQPPHKVGEDVSEFLINEMKSPLFEIRYGLDGVPVLQHIPFSLLDNVQTLLKSFVSASGIKENIIALEYNTLPHNNTLLCILRMEGVTILNIQLRAPESEKVAALALQKQIETKFPIYPVLIEWQ
jgi:hypothetical protein